MGLAVGTPAPDFVLKDQEGKEFRLSDHLGERPIVVFFYPKDFTPGCTAEVCSFRDHYSDFTDAGALVVGISSDSEKSHGRFAMRHQLPFPLLSDPGGKIRRKFAVAPKLFGLLPGRETFVLDRQGKIAMAYEAVQASGHHKRALAQVQKLI
ncbi:peroxiredoxin [Robiginitalea sediminis]|uniref:peroxiredoxin n=1 Tax=Robiginitalea sediminis TaxID=1982593 RepID=UPI000B4B8B58|nr:peroxiredoxin [Robiginitalea sediminis]